MRKRTTAAVAGAALAIGGIVASATPASAIGGNCTATRYGDKSTTPDIYSAGASCSYIQGDTRFRAWLDRNSGTDYFSSYFTTLNKTYLTGWYTCLAGCEARYQPAHV